MFKRDRDFSLGKETKWYTQPCSHGGEGEQLPKRMGSCFTEQLSLGKKGTKFDLKKQLLECLINK
jgi:hypothetical protein